MKLDSIIGKILLAAFAGTVLFSHTAFAESDAPQNDQVHQTESEPETAPGEGLSPSRVVIMAHAGGAYAAPENTLAAFRRAREAGATGLEMDVRMTKDRCLVLHHDDSINSTSNGEGKISDMTLEELKTFDFGSWFSPEFEGERIPTLEECLEEAEELGFEVVNLELKAVASNPADGEISEDNRVYVQETADTILQSGFADHVIVTSFDRVLLKAIKEYAPDIPAGIITIPDMTFLTMVDLTQLIPADKPLQDFEAEDVKNFPEMLLTILKGFGAQGGTPEETLLELVHGVAAAVPPGTSYNELKGMLAEETDLAAFMDKLVFPTEYLICHYNTLTEELLEEMHNEDIRVFAWTPDKEYDLKKVLALSPDGVVTNHPETALEIMNLSGAEEVSVQ